MAVKRKIAVVGLGSIGKRHARLWKEREEFSVEGVEPDKKIISAAKKEIGDLPIHSDFDRMLKTQPEIVLIATPHGLHAEQTIQALNAGCHVFCEKPMSNRLDTARKMKAAADRSEKILNIGFHFHFHPALQKLKSLIAKGALGQVLHAYVRVGTYQTLVCSQSRYQCRQEGALMFDYAHQPDILYWMLNEKPAAVVAQAAQAGDFALSSNPNFIDILCRYDSPLMTAIHLNYAQRPDRHEYEIVGDQGWAILDVFQGSLKTARHGHAAVKTQKICVERDDIYRAEHQAFLDAVDGKRKPETSAADGLISVAVCQAALESWKKGRWISIVV